jgi:hypothetical protein
MATWSLYCWRGVQSESVQCLMLLLLGELGRVSDLSAFPEVEQFIVRALSEGREDVKATASLALGGVAVGNVSQHLPLLLSRIEQLDSTSSKQLYLLLKSLNEVLRTLLSRNTPMPAGPPVTLGIGRASCVRKRTVCGRFLFVFFVERHILRCTVVLAESKQRFRIMQGGCGAGQQEQVLQLLHKCMHVPDECRTMVSDCLAQLTFMSPAVMGQWLLEQLGSDAATSRGVAVAAVKHVMHDGNSAVPELAQCASGCWKCIPTPIESEVLFLLGVRLEIGQITGYKI